MKKKFLALLLAAAMLVTYMPAMMFASSVEKDAKDETAFELEATADASQKVKLTWKTVEDATDYVVYGNQDSEVDLEENVTGDNLEALQDMTDEEKLEMEKTLLKELDVLEAVDPEEEPEMEYSVEKISGKPLKLNVEYVFYVAAYNDKEKLIESDMVKCKTGEKSLFNSIFNDEEATGEATEETEEAIESENSNDKPLLGESLDNSAENDVDHVVHYQLKGTKPANCSKLPYDEYYFKGDVVEIAEPLTAPGCTFSGWTLPQGVTANKGEFTMPAKDVTITGTFQGGNAKISFDTGCEKKVSDLTGTIGGAIPSRDMPVIERTGYELEGWYETADFSTDKITKLPETFAVASKTYYAKWKQTTVTYTINHYTEAPSWFAGSHWVLKASETKVATVGTYVTASYISLEGYDPLTDTTDEIVDDVYKNNYKKNGQVIAHEDGEAGLELNLYYKAQRYEVEFNANIPDSEESEILSSLNLYSFADSETAVDDDTEIVEAKYGDTFICMPVEHSGENAWTADGYTLTGWNKSKYGFRQSYDNGQVITVQEDMDLYGEWEGDCYPLTLWRNASDSDTIYAVQTFPYTENSQNIMECPFEYEGHVLKGWATTAERAKNKIIDYQPEGNITISQPTNLYAIWDTENVTLRFHAGKANGMHINADGVLADSAKSDTKANKMENTFTYKFAYNQEFNLSNESDHFVLDGYYKDSFEFAGWNTMENGSGEFYPANKTIKVSRDTDLYAQWKEKEFTVKFRIPGTDWEKTVSLKASGEESVPFLKNIRDDLERKVFYPSGKAAKYTFDEGDPYKTTQYAHWVLNSEESGGVTSFPFGQGGAWNRKINAQANSYGMSSGFSGDIPIGASRNNSFVNPNYPQGNTIVPLTHDLVFDLELEDTYTLVVHSTFPEEFGGDTTYEEVRGLTDRELDYYKWTYDYDNKSALGKLGLFHSDAHDSLVHGIDPCLEWLNTPENKSIIEQKSGNDFQYLPKMQVDNLAYFTEPNVDATGYDFSKTADREKFEDKYLVQDVAKVVSGTLGEFSFVYWPSGNEHYGKTVYKIKVTDRSNAKIKESLIEKALQGDGKLHIYMKWMKDPAKNFHTITFHSGEQEERTAKQEFNTSVSTEITLNNPFTREGYDLDGWATSKGGKKVYEPKQILSADSATGITDLYAVWKTHEYEYYNVTFVNIDTPLTKTIQNDGMEAVMAEITANASDWYTQTFKEGEKQVILKRSEIEGAGLTTEAEVEEGTDYLKGEIADPDEVPFTKEGYEFEHFYTVGYESIHGYRGKSFFSGPKVEIGDQLYIDHDIILIAKWKKLYDKHVKIVRAWDNEVQKEGNYALHDTCELPNIKTYGYTFKGYTTEPNGAGTFFEAGTKLDITEDLTLYAQRETDSYNVEFVSGQQGTVGTMEDMVVKYKESFTLPECTMTCPGYKFVGWRYANTDTVLPANSETSVDSWARIFAVWEKIPRITFMSNNGQDEIVTQDVDLGGNESKTVVLNKNTFKNPGFKFAGWCTSPTYDAYRYDKTYSDEGNIELKDDVKLYALWQEDPDIKTIRLFSNIDDTTTVYMTKTGVYKWNNKFTIPGISGEYTESRDRTFREWNTSPDGTGETYQAGTLFRYEEDLNLYAIWDYKDYPKGTITYHSNDGQNAKFVQEGYIGKRNMSVIPFANTDFTELDGKDFVVWNTKEDGSGTSASGYGYDYIEDFLEGSETDVHLYAQWKTEKRSVVLYSDEKDDYKPLTRFDVEYGGSQKLQIYDLDSSKYVDSVMTYAKHWDPTAAGSKIIGWTTQKGSNKIEYKPGATINNVTKDTKLYAVTTPIGYPIGGRIYRVDKENIYTYKFYDANGNELTNHSAAGLQTAVTYTRDDPNHKSKNPDSLKWKGKEWNNQLERFWVYCTVDGLPYSAPYYGTFWDVERYDEISKYPYDSEKSDSVRWYWLHDNAIEHVGYSQTEYRYRVNAGIVPKYTDSWRLQMRKHSAFYWTYLLKKNGLDDWFIGTYDEMKSFVGNTNFGSAFYSKHPDNTYSGGNGIYTSSSYNFTGKFLWWWKDDEDWATTLITYSKGRTYQKSYPNVWYDDGTSNGAKAVPIRTF